MVFWFAAGAYEMNNTKLGIVGAGAMAHYHYEGFTRAGAGLNPNTSKSTKITSATSGNRRSRHGPWAGNVPAVYDVLPARIRALRSKDQGWQNVPEQRRGNERSE
jgi:hypothetical protein